MGSCDLLCLDLEAAEAVRSALDTDAAVRLASTLKLFGDPTRLLIVEALVNANCADAISAGSRTRATKLFPTTSAGCVVWDR